VLEVGSGPTETFFEILNSGFTEVPEPTTLGLVGLGGVALLTRRRRG